MRIAYFTNQYPAISHTFIRREIVALEGRGHTVLRFALRKASQDFEDQEDIRELANTRHVLGLGAGALLWHAILGLAANPIKATSALLSAFRFSAASKRGRLLHLAYWVEALVLAAWCRREKVEHVHVHFGTNAATVGALLSEMTGTPFSFTVHGPEEFDRAEDHSLGAKIARASFVVAVSSFGRSQLMRWARLEDWAKLHVVHCGLDHAYRDSPDEKIGEEPRLLCVARLSEQKGHFSLLRAAALLRDRGTRFELTLVGDGPMRGAIEMAIRDLDLGDSVRLAGWMSQPEIRRQIRRSRAMVLPSFAEGLPVVLMESMALGRPVISTYIAGIPELVGPDNGWLVPAGDVAALADAMEAVLVANPEAVRQLGGRARRKVTARHDIDTSALLIERHILRARPGGHAAGSAADAGQAAALGAVT